ncbi:MAG: maltose/maltodextrin ABC transporter substrate-binding protein MalE [Anaerolineales bacterium]
MKFRWTRTTISRKGNSQFGISLFLLYLLLFSFLNAACRPQRQSGKSTLTPTSTATTLPTPTLTPTPAVLNGTISIWHSWDETQRAALFRTISVFQSLYPQVQFDVLYVPAIDLVNRFEEALSQGAGPTLLIAPAHWGARFYEQGYVLELDRYDISAIAENLNEAALETGVYRGKRICLPITMNGVVLYRNKNLIPTTAQTFEQLRAFATTATESGIVGADLERSFFFSGGHLVGLGGLLLTADGLPAFQQEDYHFALEWLELLKAFEQVGMTEYNSDNDLKLFQQGRVGLIVEGSWNRYLIAGEVGPLNLAIDPWPTYQDGYLAGFVQSEGIFLTRNIQHEQNDLSWLFVQTLYTSEALSGLGNVGLIPAIRSNQLADHGGPITIGDPFITQSITALEKGIAYPTAPEMEIVQKQMDSILRAVLFQGMNHRVALQLAYERILEEINTSRQNSTSSP